MSQKSIKQNRLRMSEETADFIRSLHPEIKRRVKAALKAAILSDPDIGKSLRSELDGLRSFRVGRFRIIYRKPSRGSIDIVAIGPRKYIYEETYRLVMKSASDRT
jgi:mRNA interferase RelE/StbE